MEWQKQPGWHSHTADVNDLSMEGEAGFTRNFRMFGMPSDKQDPSQKKWVLRAGIVIIASGCAFWLYLCFLDRSSASYAAASEKISVVSLFLVFHHIFPWLWPAALAILSVLLAHDFRKGTQDNSSKQVSSFTRGLLPVAGGAVIFIAAALLIGLLAFKLLLWLITHSAVR